MMTVVILRNRPVIVWIPSGVMRNHAGPYIEGDKYEDDPAESIWSDELEAIFG